MYQKCMCMYMCDDMFVLYPAYVCVCPPQHVACAPLHPAAQGHKSKDMYRYNSKIWITHTHIHVI